MLYIFDKDGTICQSKSGQKFINSIEDQELIPGVKEKINGLKTQGHKIAIASNQGGVAFGYMTYYEARQIMYHAATLIKADDWNFCPYHPNGTVEPYNKEDFNRKPNPGMLQWIMVNLGYLTTETIFIGDRLEDQQAAQNARVEFVWAKDFFKG